MFQQGISRWQPKESMKIVMKSHMRLHIIYLSTTTILRQTHITLVIWLLSWQLSGMTVCASISLAVTAHELSFSLTFSSLNTCVLINIGGIDIYYLKQRFGDGGKTHNVNPSLFLLCPSSL